MMTLCFNFPDNSSRRVPENLFFLVVLCVVLFATGCAGTVSGNNGTVHQPPQQQVVKITNVQASAPTHSGFQVGWLTNVPANSQIEYGTSAAYGSITPVDATIVTAHQVTLTSLAAGVLYHYRARSTDANNNQAVSEDFTFATAGNTTPPVVTIMSPASGATLSGTTVSLARATSARGVGSGEVRLT